MKPLLTTTTLPVLAALLAAASITSASAAVIINNPATEFSATSNANGVWSYGYSVSLGSAFTIITTPSSIFGIPSWRANIAGSQNPTIGVNSSASPINAATATVGPGEMHLHPGPDREFAILRYTAMDTATYSISGSFFGQDSVYPTTSDVHLLVNGLSIWNGAVNGFGPASSAAFNTSVSLMAGSTLDFVVGVGSNGNFAGDSTGLFASISHEAVPEPSSALLGLSAFGLLARRRRQAC